MASDLLGVLKKAMGSCIDFKKIMHFFSLIVMKNGV